MARKRKRQRSARQRSALRKAQLVSARKRMKASDTIGYYLRKVPGIVANAGTGGKATKISGILEPAAMKHSRRYGKYRQM